MRPAPRPGMDKSEPDCCSRRMSAHLTPLDRAPLVYPKPPLPIPDAGLELPTLLEVVSAPYVDEDEVEDALPLVSPLTLPLVTPRPTPRDDVDVPAALLLSSSSAFLRASSRRRSTSAARLSASCCFCSASFSMSTRSCVDPFQSVLRISRWLCSVCERIRVQVLSSVEALSTVLETVWSLEVSQWNVVCNTWPAATNPHVSLGPLQCPDDSLDHLIDSPDPFEFLS